MIHTQSYDTQMCIIIVYLNVFKPGWNRLAAKE